MTRGGSDENEIRKVANEICKELLIELMVLSDLSIEADTTNTHNKPPFIQMSSRLYSSPPSSHCSPRVTSYQDYITANKSVYANKAPPTAENYDLILDDLSQHITNALTINDIPIRRIINIMYDIQKGLQTVKDIEILQRFLEGLTEHIITHGKNTLDKTHIPYSSFSNIKVFLKSMIDLVRKEIEIPKFCTVLIDDQEVKNKDVNLTLFHSPFSAVVQTSSSKTDDSIKNYTTTTNQTTVDTTTKRTNADTTTVDTKKWVRSVSFTVGNYTVILQNIDEQFSQTMHTHYNEKEQTTGGKKRRRQTRRRRSQTRRRRSQTRLPLNSGE